MPAVPNFPKPFDTYFGGKEAEGAYQTIINHIRPHKAFLELYAGNASITRYKRPAEFNYLNDIDPDVTRRLQEVSVFDLKHSYKVLNKPATELIMEFIRIPRSCIYMDPPYPLNSRKSARKRYKFEMSDRDHEELLDFYLPDLAERHDVLISTYPNTLYESRLLRRGWTLVEYQVHTQSGTATEWLFFNYPKPDKLHDYRYLGNNYTDRQRLARKSARLLEKLANLPPIERNKIISDLQNHFAP